MINLVQLIGGVMPRVAHEVRHVLLVSSSRAGALLAGEPDFFLGDCGGVNQAGELAGRASEAGRAGVEGRVISVRSVG